MSLETKRCTVAFVIFYDEERYLEECMYYIGKIQMPLGMDVEIIGITEETDFTEGVREAEAASSAEYKIYMDQHTLIIHDLILYDLLTVFRENPEVDAVGILGGENSEDMNHGWVLLWNEKGLKEINRQDRKEALWVKAVNPIFIAVRYPAERDKEKGKLYTRAILPRQKVPWCIYDCGNTEMTVEVENYRFMVRRVETCRDRQAIEAVAQLLRNGTLSWENHIRFVEKETLGGGSMAPYYWEDALFLNRRWDKYLLADGRVWSESREKNVMHVAVALNRGYVVYAAVMLQSLYENNSLCKVCVHVLHDKLTEGDKQGLERQARKFGNHIFFYDISPSLLPENVQTTKEWPEEAYFRLFMTKVLPEGIERILYLDADIIVNKPLYDFYFMDMQGYELVGCRDFSTVLQEEFQDKRRELFAQLKKDRDFVYINSGVILMNLSALRERDIVEEYLSTMREQEGRLLAPDQDIINLVHWKKTGLLDEFRYDFFNACLKGGKEGEVRQYVSIIHYGGPSKPWVVKNIDAYAHKIWWEYAVRTDLAGTLIYELICGEKQIIAGQRKIIGQMKYCKHVPFMSCEADGVKYIGNSQDSMIIRSMYDTGETWSKKEIDIFFELAEEFYGYEASEAEGIFLDIGGNIGTTSIYVNKVKAPQLKIIAFEPVRDNIRIFRANCALNDISEEKILLVEKVISNRTTVNLVEKNIFNPGASRVVPKDMVQIWEAEEVESTTLDDYLERSGIRNGDIRYLWIDVEGYEGYAIDGAKKLLESVDIPVMTEFVPSYLKKQGCYEMLIEDLSILYPGFIWMEEAVKGEARVREIGTLPVFGEELGDRQADIFLVKKY